MGIRGKQPNKTSYSIAQQGRGMGCPRHLSTSPVLHHQISPPNGTAPSIDSRGRPHPFADGSGEAETARPGPATSGIGSGVNAAEALVGGGGLQVCSLPLSGWFLSAHWPARSRAVLLFWPKLFVLTILRSKISAQIIRSSYFARLEAEILDEYSCHRLIADN